MAASYFDVLGAPTTVHRAETERMVALWQGLCHAICASSPEIAPKSFAEKYPFYMHPETARELLRTSQRERAVRKYIRETTQWRLHRG